MSAAVGDVPALQLSTFFDALNELRVCSTDAAAAAASDGGTGASPPAWEPVWGDSTKMKALLPGSILVLANGAVAKVPVDRALITSSASPQTVSLSVITEVGGTATLRNEAWCAANIGSVYAGILTDTKAGPHGGGLKMNSVPVTLSLVPNPDTSNPTAFSHVLVSGAGLVPKAVTIAGLPSMGLALRPWAGGDRQPRLHQGGGIPDISALSTTTAVVDRLVGNDGVTVLRKAMLQILGLITSTSVVDLPIPVLATFVAGTVGMDDRQLALQLVLATTTDAIGVSPTQTALRLAKLRAVMVASLGKLWDSLGPLVIIPLQARLASMVASGYALSPGGGGSVLRYLHDELLVQERARVHALAAAPPRAPLIAPLALVATLAPLVAPAPLAAPVAAVPPSHLQGIAVLRPPPAPPATSVLTNLEVFVGLGGELVVRRIAALCGFTDPLIFMTGNGSVASAAEAADNFATLLDTARAAAPSDTRLFPTAAPVDMEEAGATLRVVMRVVELAARGGTIPTVASSLSGSAAVVVSTALQKRDPSLSKELKTVPASAGTERIMRACSASLVNPICTDKEVRQAALHMALVDPIAEARRNIDLHGPRAAGFLLSSQVR